MAGVPALGGWARAEGVVGLVAAIDADEVAIFDPAARRVIRVTPEQVEAIPAGAVTVTATVDLPLPHGLAEDDLRRWVAALLDPMIRERAVEALADAELDVAAALPAVALAFGPAAGEECLCLAGHHSPTAQPGTPQLCPTCGRMAVPRPVAGR